MCYQKNPTKMLVDKPLLISRQTSVWRGRVFLKLTLTDYTQGDPQLCDEREAVRSVQSSVKADSLAIRLTIALGMDSIIASCKEEKNTFYSWWSQRLDWLFSEEFLKGTTLKTKTKPPPQCQKASRGWTTPGKGKLWFFLRSCLTLPGKGLSHSSCAAPPTNGQFPWNRMDFAYVGQGERPLPLAQNWKEHSKTSSFPQWRVTHTVTLMNEKHCQDSWSGQDLNELDTAQRGNGEDPVCLLYDLNWMES